MAAVGNYETPLTPGFCRAVGNQQLPLFASSGTCRYMIMVHHLSQSLSLSAVASRGSSSAGQRIRFSPCPNIKLSNREYIVTVLKDSALQFLQVKSNPEAATATPHSVLMSHCICAIESEANKSPFPASLSPSGLAPSLAAAAARGA